MVMVLAGPALAQSGAELMLGPWPEQADDQDAPQVELDGGFRYSWDGSVDGSGADFELARYTAGGRYRLNTQRGAPAVGYELTFLDLDTADAALPNRLLDTSAGIGFGLGKWRDWELAATVGGGFAGDTPFSDDDAWYAKANLLANNKLDKNRSIHLGLNFDGNRTIWPDAPLPVFAYHERVDESLRYSAGLPFSSVRWQPADRLTLEASTIVFVSYSAEARYRLAERVSVFAGYDGETTAFHREGDDEHRRLLYSSQQIEAGLRLDAAEIDNARFVLAGGYAFDREFERGFDVRDTTSVRDVSDEPYVRASFDLAF
jgi:hypothetical protein